MKLKQIASFNGKAPKLRHGGYISYQLWVDDVGKFYVRLEDNTLLGTFSNLLFPVSKYAASRNSNKRINQLMGYDLNQNYLLTHPSDRNNAGFLKAVLRDLLP